MGTFGGFAPYPRRFGGGRTRVQEVLEGVVADRGDALDATNSDTVVYVESLAIARVIAAAWSTNERLSRLWTPMRTSMDVITRWEKILALTPTVSDTNLARRTRVQEVLERFGQPSVHAQIVEALAEKLGDAFVAVEYIGIDNAVIAVPDGTYPWGSVAAGTPWSSTVAHILVRLQKPAGRTENDFYQEASRVVDLLDPLIPSWATFDWYREPATGTPIDVTDGPSAGGFYLDDEHNLDNNVFDV